MDTLRKIHKLLPANVCTSHLYYEEGDSVSFWCDDRHYAGYEDISDDIAVGYVLGRAVAHILEKGWRLSFEMGKHVATLYPASFDQQRNQSVDALARVSGNSLEEMCLKVLEHAGS